MLILVVIEPDVVVWTREQVNANLHKPLRDYAPRATPRRSHDAEEDHQGGGERRSERVRLGLPVPASTAATGKEARWKLKVLEWRGRDWLRTMSLLLVAGISPKLVVTIYRGFLNLSDVLEKTYKYTT